MFECSRRQGVFLFSFDTLHNISLVLEVNHNAMIITDLSDVATSARGNHNGSPPTVCLQSEVGIIALEETFTVLSL